MAKATTKTKTEQRATRTLIVHCKGDTLRKIEVPVAYAVTYGPIAVGARNISGESPNVLRIYTDSKKSSLMAVFRDVVSFYDDQVLITERRTKTESRTVEKQGNSSGRTVVAQVRQTKWVDPLAEDDGGDSSDVDTLSFKSLSGPEVNSVEF
jgi:hypothetical protein